MKTPEEMALEYAEDWHKDCDYPAEILRHTKKATETVFLAGYQAAKELYAAKLKEANDTVAGMADECEGLKTIIYDHDETNLLTPAKWISVKERLPENGIEVLVVSDGETGASWHEAGEFGWAIGGTVTHWMPLPKPPKEEK